MATSPREELRIVSVTEFTLDGQGFWDWCTRTVDGEVTLSCTQLADTFDQAVHDFFRAVNYDPAVLETDPTLAHYSQPVFIDPQEYHIREYAYGAPEPWRV